MQSHLAPLFRILFCVLVACAPVAMAGNACFSLDGARVYLKAAGVETPCVEEIGLDDGVHRLHHLDVVGGLGEVDEMDTLADGALVLLCRDTLWKWSPGSRTAQRLQTAPEGMVFAQLAADANGALAVWCRFKKMKTAERPGTLFVAKKPDAELRVVRMRRIDHVSGLCFHGPDALFFGTEGDLWDGLIEYDDEQPTLAAHRFAPLSDRETYNGTPMQIGVMRVAVSKNKVYAHLARMGGSGWGNVVRLSLPAACEPKSATKDIRDQVHVYANALNSVEVLGENGTLSYLCASRDGRRVFFTDRIGEGRTCYLIENDGPAEPTKVFPLKP